MPPTPVPDSVVPDSDGPRHTPARMLPTLQEIRNIGIIAHIDAGKTTLSERILFRTGSSYRIGDVDDGTTTMDWMVQERERGITITAAATMCRWRGHRINIVDTPGHVDFTVEVERCLRILDGAVVVFSAVEGVEAQSETVWRQANRYQVPRIAFINKCDRSGADPRACVAQMGERLRCRPILVQLPCGLQNEFTGIVDLIHQRAGMFVDGSGEMTLGAIPPAMDEQVRQARTCMLEQLADVDDTILAALVEGQEPRPETLIAALRRATIAAKAVPVVLGSALRNLGVSPLLDAIVNFLPSPSDLPEVAGTNAEGQVVTFAADPGASLVALAFKVVHDRHSGQLTYVRVYAGTLEVGGMLYNTRAGRCERVTRLVRMHANKRVTVSRVAAGDLAAVTGLRHTQTGDTLCSEENPVLLERMTLPVPLMQVAIDPVDRNDREKLSQALRVLTREDPSFQSESRRDLGEILLLGMGELHLEILVDRLRRDFSIEAAVATPQVAYREAITTHAEGCGKYVHHGTCRPQFAHLRLSVAPGAPLSGIVFAVAPGCTLPEAFVPPIERGVRGILARGAIAGCPFIDLEVRLEGGSYHAAESSAIAFQIAGGIAAFEAVTRAHPVLQEPIMSLEIDAPEVCIGAVLADQGIRGGRIVASETINGGHRLCCETPLSALHGFSSDLLSLTQGRATFAQRFCRYEKARILPSDLLKGQVPL